MAGETRPIKDLGLDWHSLIRRALRVQQRAYAPYSKFFVGSVILDERGRVHTGCNVENASYSAAVCAERAAIAKMVSRGGKRIEKIVVVTSSAEPIFPCGVCLQVIGEFGGGAEVVAIDREASVFRKSPFSQLLPLSFRRDQLEEAEK